MSLVNRLMIFELILLRVVKETQGEKEIERQREMSKNEYAGMCVTSGAQHLHYFLLSLHNE